MGVSVCVLATALGAGASAATPARTPVEALRAASAPRPQLVRTRTVDFHGFRVQRYQQRVDGYPVLGGQATVVSAPGEPARLAADATSPRAARETLRPSWLCRPFRSVFSASSLR